MVKVERYSYGWSIKDTSEWLAAVALMMHTAFVIGHIGMVVSRKRRFTRWMTLGELLELSNASPRIPNLADEQRLKIVRGELRPVS